MSVEVVSQKPNIVEVIRNNNSSSIYNGVPLGQVVNNTTNIYGVSGINNIITGHVYFTGDGATTVSVNGQIITVTSTDNISAAISGLATSGFCTGISGVLQEQLDTLNNNTGNYYLNSNPYQYVTSGNLQATGQSLQNQISAITAGTGNFISAAQTGQFYPASNPNQYSTSGNLFQTGSNLDSKINSLSGYSNTTFSTIANLASTGSNLQSQINSINNNTGQFYLNSNPSGYLNTLSGLSVEFVTGVSGALQSQFYPITNPNQYIRSGDVSSVYSTIANLQSTGANLQSQINNITNNTGQFYLSSNPQQYVNSGNLFDTGNTLNNKINSLSGYISNNPSGYLNSLSGLSTGYVLGASGQLYFYFTGLEYDLYLTGNNLQTQINNVSNNLQATGQNLQQQIDGLTGLSSSASSVAYNLSKSLLPTGLDIYSVSFPVNFSTPPLVFGNLTTTGNGFIYGFDLSGINNSGFYLRLTDRNANPELKFNYLIISGSGALGVSSFSNTVSYNSKNSNYNVSSTDDFIECSGTFNVYLPLAAGNLGKKYIIKNSNSGVVSVTPSSISELIDSFSGVNLYQYDSVTVVSNNSKWLII